MNIKELILSMTREDFKLFEERRDFVNKKTHQEIENERQIILDKKFARAKKILDSHGISIDKESHSQSRRAKKYTEYFGTNPERFAMGLGTKECWADLRKYTQDSTTENVRDQLGAFCDLAIRFDGNELLDSIL